MQITKEEARDILKTLWRVSVKGSPIEKALEIAIQALETQQWIPCSEKDHPDLPIRVQVQMINGWIITAYYQDGEWLSVPNCEDAIHDKWIEAWRYLPEPWKGDAE